MTGSILPLSTIVERGPGGEARPLLAAREGRGADVVGATIVEGPHL